MRFCPRCTSALRIGPVREHSPIVTLICTECPA